MSQPEQLTFSFSGFSVEQVNLILGALKELPYKQVADLIAGITNVAQAQAAAFKAKAEQASQPPVLPAPTVEVVPGNELP